MAYQDYQDRYDECRVCGSRLYRMDDIEGGASEGLCLRCSQDDDDGDTYDIDDIIEDYQQ